MVENEENMNLPNLYMYKNESLYVKLPCAVH